MPPALDVKPPAAPGVAFELERLALAEGRLELSGRWSGVRGRRFVRPTLTLHSAGERRRLLAELEHKPWSPEQEPWQAAFPWEGELEEVAAVELAVAPDISIALALPTRQGRRKPSMPTTVARVEHERMRTELERLRDDRQALEQDRAQLGGERDRARSACARAEEALKAEVAARSALAAEREALIAEREALIAEREALIAERDALAAERDALAAERDALITQAAEASAERDELSARCLQLAAEREGAVAARDDALAARGAALVMHNARAAATPSPASSRLGRIAAVALLLGVLVAALVAVHVL